MYRYLAIVEKCNADTLVKAVYSCLQYAGVEYATSSYLLPFRVNTAVNTENEVGQYIFPQRSTTIEENKCVTSRTGGEK